MMAPRCDSRDSLPVIGLGQARGEIPARQDGTIHPDSHRVEVPDRDPNHASPTVDGALASGVQSRGNNSPIRAEANRVPVPGRDSDDLRPVRDITGPLIPAAGGQHGAIGAHPHGAAPPGSDTHHLRPARDLALTVHIPPGRQERAVGTQTNRMGLTSVPRRMDVASGDRDNVPPLGHRALRGRGRPRRTHTAAIHDAQGMPAAGGKPDLTERHRAIFRSGVQPTGSRPRTLARSPSSSWDQP